MIATAMVIVRDRLRQREVANQLALQQKIEQLGHLNEQLRVITDRLQSELNLARDIQQSLLPPSSPGWPYLDVACYSKPAFEVGGDFYSYQTFSDGASAWQLVMCRARAYQRHC